MRAGRRALLLDCATRCVDLRAARLACARLDLSLRAAPARIARERHAAHRAVAAAEVRPAPSRHCQGMPQPQQLWRLLLLLSPFPSTRMMLTQSASDILAPLNTLKLLICF